MKIRKSLLLVAILLISVLTFYGCPKKAEVTATPEVQKEETDADRAAAAKKAEEERLAAEAKAREEEEAAARERAAAAEAAGLKPIYFDFDRSNVREDARAVMMENAGWLKARPNVKVRIEGNADERGTIEYNQALGQRRASSAKKYLTDLGISSKRISIISYGKEKPVCTESTEECWQKNRRAELVAE
jgi:peptidoglycan-associated lipoprotein